MIREESLKKTMKKCLVAIATVLMSSCATHTVTEISGTVDRVEYKLYHYEIKVWCKDEGRYYKVYTDTRFQLGDRVRIICVKEENY